MGQCTLKIKFFDFDKKIVSNILFKYILMYLLVYKTLTYKEFILPP